MRQYLINYDLCLPGQKYALLQAALQRLKAIPVMQSTWILSTTIDAIAIRNELARHLDGNDRILVVEIGADTPGRANLYPLGELVLSNRHGPLVIDTTRRA